MNDSLNIKNPLFSIRMRAPIKLDTNSVRNTNHLKNRFKLDTSLVLRDPQPQDYLSELQTYRKRETSKNNLSALVNVPSNQATNHDSFTSQDFLDPDLTSLDAKFDAFQVKDLSKLPGLILKQKATANNVNAKPQGITGNSSLSTNHESQNESLIKRIENTQAKEAKEGSKRVIKGNRNPSTCKAAQPNDITMPIQDRTASPELKNRPRIRPISVEKREALRAFAFKEEISIAKKIREKEREEEIRGLKDSYKTLTSAFNSNKTLEDLPTHAWEEGLERDKVIKEVVEKHVEEAYKNISLIKKNFQRRSKTYLFYIYKDN